MTSFVLCVDIVKCLVLFLYCIALYFYHFYVSGEIKLCLYDERVQASRRECEQVPAITLSRQ